MKRSLIYKLLLIPVLFLIGYMNVFAEDGILLCEYNGIHENNADKKNDVRIYYNPSSNNWTVMYYDYGWKNHDYKEFTSGTFANIFANDKKMWVNRRGKLYSADAVNAFQCKKKVLVDYYDWDHELCFADDTCFDKENGNFTKNDDSWATDTLTLNTSVNTPFTYIDQYNINDDIKTQLSSYKDVVNKNTSDITQTIHNNINNAIKNKFNTDAVLPFIDNYVNEKIKENSDSIDATYKLIVSNAIDEANRDPNATEEEKSALLLKKDLSFSTEFKIDVIQKNEESSETSVDDFSHNCADMAKTIRMGGYLIFIVKIIIPLIIIVKSSMNLASTVMSGSQDAVKKAVQKLGVSLAAGVIIFVLPTILDAIFGLVDDYSGHDSGDFAICEACVFEPFSDECKNSAEDPTKDPYFRNKQ